MSSSIFDKNYALSGIESAILVEEALGTLLWSEYDWEHDEQIPLDQLFTVEDFSDDSINQIRRELFAFIEANADDLDGINLNSIAHDFILTRNGHGAGFWDRGYPDGIGERLTVSAKGFGPANVYLGDDSQLFIA
jgi:hypothetical protein